MTTDDNVSILFWKMQLQFLIFILQTIHLFFSSLRAHFFPSIWFWTFENRSTMDSNSEPNKTKFKGLF